MSGYVIQGTDLLLPLSTTEVDEDALLRAIDFVVRNHFGEPYNTADEKAVEDMGNLLEHIIFAKLRPLLRSAGIKRLVIISQGMLLHLPYAVAKGPSGYLIEEFEIACAPSLLIAQEIAERPRFHAQGLGLVIGNVDPRLKALARR